jgi:hypothetical protein
MKTLYTLTVNKEITKEVNGEQVKESTPVYFALAKPSRFEKEEAELVRAEYLSKFIRRGVLPEAVLSKTYSDMGGTMNENEKNDLISLNISLYEATAEFRRLNVQAEKNEELINAELTKIIECKRQITDIQQRQSSFLENTAEFKAKTKLIEYLFTSLTYWKEKESDEWKPYFVAETFEQKLDLVEKLDEENDELYLKIKNHFILAVSVFVHKGGNVQAEEVKRIVEEND